MSNSTNQEIGANKDEKYRHIYVIIEHFEGQGGTGKFGNAW